MIAHQKRFSVRLDNRDRSGRGQKQVHKDLNHWLKVDSPLSAGSSLFHHTPTACPWDVTHLTKPDVNPRLEGLEPCSRITAPNFLTRGKGRTALMWESNEIFCVGQG